MQRPASIGYLPQEPKAAFRPEQPVLQCLLEARGLLALSQQLERDAQTMSQLAEGSQELKPLLAAYGRAQTEWEYLGGYEAESLARRLLDGLGMGHVDFNQHFANLSGGQKTRLALAALLFRQPELLILDEPTNHLDRSSAGWLMDFLVSLPGTVLLVSHDLVLLDRAIARVLRIDETSGELEAYRGNYSSYLAQREARRLQVEKQARLAGRQMAQMQATADRWRSGTRATQAKSIEKRIERLREGLPEKMSASKGPKLQTLATAPSSRLVLEVEELWKAYGENIVLLGVGFTLERGQKLALLGPNGAGKTTLLKTIAGFLKPSRGTLLFAGQDTRGLTPEKVARLGVRYVFQDKRVFSKLTVRENLELAAFGSGERAPGAIRKVMDIFPALERFLDAKAGGLSGGQRQLLLIGRALVGRPRLILLDEPTEGLAAGVINDIVRVLGSMRGEISMLVVEQSLSVVEKLADRVYIMKEGKVSQEIAKPEMLERSLLEASL